MQLRLLNAAEDIAKMPVAISRFQFHHIASKLLHLMKAYIHYFMTVGR